MPLTDTDYVAKYGMTKAEFAAQKKERNREYQRKHYRKRMKALGKKIGRYKPRPNAKGRTKGTSLVVKTPEDARAEKLEKQRAYRAKRKAEGRPYPSELKRKNSVQRIEHARAIRADAVQALFTPEDLFTLELIRADAMEMYRSGVNALLANKLGRNSNGNAHQRKEEA